MTTFDTNPQFAKLLAGRDDVCLVQLMLELAADAYPNLDCVGCLMEIDRLGVACADQLSGRIVSARERLQVISRQLYEVEGFHGNREAYYEPQNSYLNEVLARRCGIPISLGILYMAVASCAGLKMYGVNMPGHFVIGCSSGCGRLFVDPFNNGDVLDLTDCKCRVEQMNGQQATVAVEDFRPARPIEIVRARAAQSQSGPRHARCLDRRAGRAAADRGAAAASADEQRDLGLVHLRLGQAARRCRFFEQYACRCAGEEAAMVQSSIQAARRMIAEMN